MRRADRLFQLIQILRRERGRPVTAAALAAELEVTVRTVYRDMADLQAQRVPIRGEAGGRPVTAAALAAELEVTVRTVYRDMADLQAQRVPIRGEAGVGYVLGSGYDLPALMFTEDEIEALVLGARIVQSWADPALGRAAGDLLAKVAAVVPAALQAKIDGLSLFSPPASAAPAAGLDVARLRRWVREQRKLRIAYADAAGARTQRTLWPQALAFFPPVWLLIGWCELRQDFRSFRLDRVGAADFLEERYPQTQGRRLVDFIARMRAEPAAKGLGAGRR